MKRLVLSAALVAVALAGAAGCCSSNCASSGWEFRMGRPATFSTPGLVQQTPGPLQIAPLGSTIPPMISGVTAAPGPVHLVSPPAQGPTRLAPAPQSLEECTCEALLAALRRIESRLATLGASKMPIRPEDEE